jgi:hypothetical protein
MPFGEIIGRWVRWKHDGRGAGVGIASLRALVPVPVGSERASEHCCFAGLGDVEILIPLSKYIIVSWLMVSGIRWW